jgi:hypothetical protein
MKGVVNDASILSLCLRFLRAKRTLPEPWFYDKFVGTHVDYTPAHFGTNMTFGENEIDTLLKLLFDELDLTTEEVNKIYFERFGYG